MTTKREQELQEKIAEMQSALEGWLLVPADANATIASLRALLKEAETALRPFAEIVDETWHHLHDENTVECKPFEGRGRHYSVKHFRQAAAALRRIAALHEEKQ